MNSSLKNILTISLPTVFFLFVVLEVTGLCCMNKSSKKKHSYGLIAIGLSHLFTNRHTKACHYI